MEFNHLGETAREVNPARSPGGLPSAFQAQVGLSVSEAGHPRSCVDPGPPLPKPSEATSPFCFHPGPAPGSWAGTILAHPRVQERDHAVSVRTFPGEVEVEQDLALS